MSWLISVGALSKDQMIAKGDHRKNTQSSQADSGCDHIVEAMESATRYCFIDACLLNQKTCITFSWYVLLFVTGLHKNSAVLS